MNVVLYDAWHDDDQQQHEAGDREDAQHQLDVADDQSRERESGAAFVAFARCLRARCAR